MSLVKSARIIIPPAEMPITLEGARQFLQVYDGADDALINMLIEAATTDIENKIQMALMPRYVLDTLNTLSWENNEYCVRWNPLLEVVHIKYYDSTNVLQTLDTALYGVYRNSQGLDVVYFKTDVTIPEVYDRPDAVQITYRCGHDPYGTIPYAILAAIQLKVRHLYDCRGQDGDKMESPLSIASNRLITPYVNYTYTTGI